MFFDGYISRPLFPKAPRLRSWGSLRATSFPRQINSNIREFISEGGIATTAAEVEINELVQALQLRAGVSFRLGEAGPDVDCNFESMEDGFAQVFSAYLILGGGLLTPEVPQENINVFEVTPEAEAALGPELGGMQYVALVSSDRDRFLTEWFAGVRLMTHYYDVSDNTTTVSDRPPAMLDVTIGKDKAVSEGRPEGDLTGDEKRWVLGLDGFFPLPVFGGEALYLFGSAKIVLNDSAPRDPLLLTRAPGDVVVPAPDVAVITVGPLNKDIYRVGVGLDIGRFFEGIVGAAGGG